MPSEIAKFDIFLAMTMEGWLNKAGKYMSNSNQ
jgi:hypothetical protein